MNKAEFAVCRIKEKLPGNQGLVTKGSGCVVHCESLASSWGWKCNYFIVTPSVVLCREDLSSNKTFVAEFLSKDKRGLETFEVKQMAEVCKDLAGRNFYDNFARGHCLSFISVEPLDKRGFLKKMVKKGSLQTFRPLDCVDSHEKESLIIEGMYCQVIADLFSESTNLPFTTQTFKLVYESDTRQFSLQDFGGSMVTCNQEKPPIGAVIFTKRGEFAGVLDFADNCMSVVFLPEPSMIDDSRKEDIPSNGENATAAVTSNNEMVRQLNDEKVMNDEHLGEQTNHQEEEAHSGSDVLCDDNSHIVKVSIDDMSHGNNNALPSSEEFQPEMELQTNTAKPEALVVEEGSGGTIYQEDRECADSLISGNKTDELETGNVLNSVNSTANVNSNFEACSEEEEVSKFSDTAEEGSDKVDEPGLAMEKASSPVDSSADIEQPALFSPSGNDIITRDDNSLVTVIQVGEIKPVEMKATEQAGTSNEEIAECNHLEKLVPSESETMTVKEHSHIEERVVECLPDNEDGEMAEPSIENIVRDQENLATDDSNVCVYTETEPIALVGSLPQDTNIETDSIQKPVTPVTTENSHDENSQADDTTLVTQDDKDLTDSSERTIDTPSPNCEVSIYVTPPNGDVVDEAEDDGNLKERHNSQEHVSEDLCQTITSAAEFSLSSDTTEETEGKQIRDSHINSDGELPGPVLPQGSSVDNSWNLEKIDAEDNTEVTYKDLDEHTEAELEQCSPRFDGNQAFITQKEFVKVADEAIVSGGEIRESSDHEQTDSVTEKMSTAESPEVIGEVQVDKHITEDALSSNIGALEKGINGQDPGTVLGPAANDEQAEAWGDCGDSSFDDALVLQRVDADSLLTETITNNPRILGDLGKCLDTEYHYGRVPCWRDLAELLDIPPEAYEHCGTYSASSPTEDLFVFLSATKPQLTIQDIKEALKEIERHDVAQLLDRKIAGGVISMDSVVGSLVERDDTDMLGRMALKLDRKRKNDWKGLALQLNVPHRVLRNFGSHQRHNSSLMLLKYIPIFDPELTLDHLKACLVSIDRQDAVEVLNKAGIPGDEPVKGILDDSDLLDQITDLLNDDPPSPHWRHLAKELKIPQEKCKIFEPTEDVNSPTKLLFKSIENCEPDLTFEELVLALVAMKRQDVLDVLQKYFSTDDVDQILEENNLLPPVEDHTDENES